MLMKYVSAGRSVSNRLSGKCFELIDMFKLSLLHLQTKIIVVPCMFNAQALFKKRY